MTKKAPDGPRAAQRLCWVCILYCFFGFPFDLGFPCPLDRFLCDDPVSYTHLDVYKRQTTYKGVPYSLARSMVSTPPMVRCPCWLTAKFFDTNMLPLSLIHICNERIRFVDSSFILRRIQPIVQRLSRELSIQHEVNHMETKSSNAGQ